MPTTNDVLECNVTLTLKGSDLKNWQKVSRKLKGDTSSVILKAIKRLAEEIEMEEVLAQKIKPKKIPKARLKEQEDVSNWWMENKEELRD